jgi:CoA-dependent NAD(P)H sulfur oxidoreductase
MPRLIVIGGNAAGMSAASKVKRSSKDWDVSVFDAGGDVSWGACGLPYTFTKEVSGFDDLYALTPEEIKKRGIELRPFQRALEILEGRKRVVFRDEKSGRSSEESYDSLLIATGSVPIQPEIRNFSGDNLFVLHTLSDGRKLADFLEKEKPGSACIIGGGYIAMEMAESLAKAGIQVRLLLRSGRMLKKLTARLNDRLALELEENGIRILSGCEINEVRKAGEKIVSLETGKGSAAADFFLYATGVRAATDFLENSKIPLGEKGGIEADEKCRTPLHSVWAAGDCCCVRNIITGKFGYVPLGTTANKMGRVAGANIAGEKEEFPGVLGTSIVRVFSMEIGMTGLNLEQALKEGFDAADAVVEAHTRPRYFRGGRDVSISLVGDRSGRLLGGQVMGGEGTKGRIDTLAAIIQSRMALGEAQYLDMAYSPPFSPVWDPLLTCISVLKNKLAI